MSPTEQLKEEHEGIRVMLDILAKVCDRLESGARVDQRHLEQILEFLKVFVDKCHHAKEEDILFPAMEQAGVPGEGGPIGVMLAEHRSGRENIRKMGEAAERLGKGDRGATSQFVQNARSYIELLLEHIEKENEILYPMADDRIPEKTQQALLAGFDKVEEERVGHGKHEEFHRLMDRLKEIYIT
ncbi:MAG: hemerythrin domain-containing protein [Actinomycetota bacterium]